MATKQKMKKQTKKPEGSDLSSRLDQLTQIVTQLVQQKGLPGPAVTPAAPPTIVIPGKPTESSEPTDRKGLSVQELADAARSGDVNAIAQLQQLFDLTRQGPKGYPPPKLPKDDKHWANRPIRSRSFPIETPCLSQLEPEQGMAYNAERMKLKGIAPGKRG